ncbi:MAG: hypothetical protein ACLGXA_05120 [Acidobacteriota bacterium]
MQVTSLSRCLIWTALAAGAGLCQAQVVQPPGTMPGRQFPVPANPPEGMAQPAHNNAPAHNAETPAGMPDQAPIHTGASATTPEAKSNLPPSLSDKPAAAARVTLDSGSLSVDADNSSLSQILKDVERTTGMTVDGFDKDSRVFGVYGPGTPRDVLSSLLEGAGYNFLMVGTTKTGAPREIVLTARSNAPISAPGPGSSQPEEDEPPQNYPPPEPVPPPPVQPPPGMPSADQRPRSPQEMLQELQRMRQQQGQSQGQPNPQ